MKKLLLIAMILGSFSTQAATVGTLLLQGIVLPKLEIIVNPATIANTLDLETSQTDLAVATVTEKSNHFGGYKTYITSPNAGNLKRSGGTEVFPYTLKYNGVAVALSASPVQVSNVTAFIPTGSVVKGINISYIGKPAESMVQGTYSETLTLSIVAN